jgi:hypothetical protein
MQRVHMDDLTGFLLSQSNEWELLSLPAIAELEETIPLGNGRWHRRQFGEALSPEREPIDVLEALKLQIGSDPSPPNINRRQPHLGARHDDQCDSISQALFDGDRKMPMEITEEIIAMCARPWSSWEPFLAASHL